MNMYMEIPFMNLSMNMYVEILFMNMYMGIPSMNILYVGIPSLICIWEFLL